jgi:hypothetical protein
MPRPTLAQLAYGSITVVGSTLAMLLLSQVSAGPGVVVIALAGLALGVLVALTVPAPRRYRAGRTVTRSAAVSATVRGAAATPPRLTARTEVEHSLHR